MKTKTQPKPTPRLPDKIHLLIDVALNDLSKVRRSKRYEIDMGSWHRGGEKVCTVCLAGAVMAKTFRVDPTMQIVDPDEIDIHPDDQRKLHALDFLRGGDIYGALDIMRIKHPKFIPDEVDIMSYYDDPAMFMREMREMQQFFRKFDL